jgi:hypothetical protein
VKKTKVDLNHPIRFATMNFRSLDIEEDEVIQPRPIGVILTSEWEKIANIQMKARYISGEYFFEFFGKIIRFAIRGTAKIIDCPMSIKNDFRIEVHGKELHFLPKSGGKFVFFAA